MKPLLRRGSLRTRIIAWSFFPAAIIMLAVVVALLYAYQQVTADLVTGRNQELTRLSAGQVAAEMSDYAGLLTALGRLSGLAGGNPQVQADTLQAASNRLVVFDGGVLVLDPQGRLTAAQPARPDVLGQDWSDRPYFRQMVRSLMPVFSDVVADGPGGADVVAICAPMLGDRGEFRGAAIGMFRLGATTISAFYGGLVKLRLQTGGSTLLVDSRGRAIYHSHPAHVGENLSADPAVAGALADHEGQMRTRDAQGADLLATFAPVAGTPWSLIKEEDWAALLLANLRYGQVLLVLLLLAALVPALAVTVGVRRITEPIGKLIAAAQEIAGGRFGQQITVHTGDELEELVTQFNRMSERLAESYAALQAREERLDMVMRGTNDGIWDLDLRAGEIYLSPRWRAMLGYQDDDIGKPLDFLPHIIHPDDWDLMQQSIRPPAGESSFSFELRMRHKDGSYRWFLTRGMVLRDAGGQPYRIAGSHTDITESKQAQAALEQAYASLERRVAERTHEIQRRREVAEGLRETLGALNSERSLDEILDHIVSQAGRLLGSDAASIARLKSREGPMSIQAACGLDADYVARIELPLGLGAEGTAIVQRRPVAMGDTAAAAERMFATAKPAEPYRSLILRLVDRFHAVLSVPMYSKDEPYGALTLYFRESRQFSDEDIQLAVGFANQAALALENAGLRDQAEQAAVEAERGRLARDLHDAVTQSLYSVTLYAEATARLLEAGQAESAVDHLRELRDTAQEALREMRLLIFELRPPALEKTGLAAALQARLEAVEERGGMHARLIVEGREDALRVPAARQREIYRIAQEALNNVLKHARAVQVGVRVEFRDALTRLEISDDGSGFALDSASGGLGLRGMRERAQSIGGTLAITSAPGTGTVVTLEVPTVQPASGEPA